MHDLTHPIQSIGILGAGAWGTALAQSFARKNLNITLWARNEAMATAIEFTRCNDTHLPEIILLPNIHVTHDIQKALACDVLVLVRPSQHIGALLEKVKADIKPHTPILIASKGIEIETGRLLSQVVGGILPHNPLGILSGPNFAIEIAKDLPAAMTLAMAEAPQSLAYHLSETLSHPHFRLYTSEDMIGVQIGGAVKNVIAIACGIAMGKEMGDNARAALLTRGLAEMVRLGKALGAEAETFLGLSGIGDLTLTCNALQSRNFSLGVAIGQGHRAVDILAQRRSIAEGYYTAAAVVKLAALYTVEMPICEAVYETLYHEKAIDSVVKHLLSRPVPQE